MEWTEHARLIAIDPGKSGGIAWADCRGTQAVKMPQTEIDLWVLINRLRTDESRGVLERLGGMPRDKETGKPKQSPTTMFKMGVNYGQLLMALGAARIPFVTARPQDWQAAVGVSRPGSAETRAEKKNRHKAEAQRRFPYIPRITLATADALLLLEYARQLHSFPPLICRLPPPLDRQEV
jgi:hypothetical protein